MLAETEERNRAAFSERVARFVEPRGDERVLDAGTGTGALAFALAPHVAEVVGVDLVPALLAEGRRRAAEFPNVSFVEGDVTSLPHDLGQFDLAASVRTLHHIRRPELAVAELVRATRPGGRILVVDQVAPIDPLTALELRLLRSQFELQTRELERYLDLAACEGDEREHARSLAGEAELSVNIGWYLLARDVGL